MERELPENAHVVEGMADRNHVVLRSEIICVGHNRKLLGFTVLKAAPHVVRFVTDAEFNDVETLLELLRFGYTVEIRPSVQEVGYGLYLLATDMERVLGSEDAWLFITEAVSVPPVVWVMMMRTIPALK